MCLARVETTTSRQLKEVQNKSTNSENRHLVFLIFKKKKQENDGVGDISSLFQRHCQTNRLYYKQAVLYIYKDNVCNIVYWFDNVFGIKTKLNIRNTRCLFSEFVLFCKGTLPKSSNSLHIFQALQFSKYSYTVLY